MLTGEQMRGSSMFDCRVCWDFTALKNLLKARHVPQVTGGCREKMLGNVRHVRPGNPQIVSQSRSLRKTKIVLAKEQFVVTGLLDVFPPNAGSAASACSAT